jgi:predicted small lipoprotein YifL
MFMKQMIHLRSVAMFAAVLLLATIAGCGRSPDERLAEFAQQTMTEQGRQNDRMAAPGSEGGNGKLPKRS